MKRSYEEVIRETVNRDSKMIFLGGPRQVGKTTTAKSALPDAFYLNWDNPTHKKLVLKGPEAVFEAAGGKILSEKKHGIIFDEIHKYRRWKNFLKGFFDLYGSKTAICVTGSARLNVYKHGGDSLMGRYFPYHMHPLSVREISDPILPQSEISPPTRISETAFANLAAFGGYPEPYLRHDPRFSNRWKRLRLEQLFSEDLRDLSHITDISRIKLLGEMLARSASSQINYSHLAQDLQLSVDTVRRWIDVLEAVFYCFRLRPWSKKISRSILREPKVFLWDWSLLADKGKRNENLVACHLLKAVHYLTDAGFGDFGLYYLRDKSNREVDFLVTQDSKPWFLVETKSGNGPLSEALGYFQRVTSAPHAFQAVFDMPFVDADCFKEKAPIKVPVRTLLSQLV